MAKGVHTKWHNKIFIKDLEKAMECHPPDDVLRGRADTQGELDRLKA